MHFFSSFSLIVSQRLTSTSRSSIHSLVRFFFQQKYLHAILTSGTRLLLLLCCVSSLDFEIMDRLFLRFVKCFPLIGQFFFCAGRDNDRAKKRGIHDENEWKCLEQIFMWATVISILYVSFFCLSLAHTLDYLSLFNSVLLHFILLLLSCVPGRWTRNLH